MHACHFGVVPLSVNPILAKNSSTSFFVVAVFSSISYNANANGIKGSATKNSDFTFCKSASGVAKEPIMPLCANATNCSCTYAFTCRVANRLCSSTKAVNSVSLITAEKTEAVIRSHLRCTPRAYFEQDCAATLTV